MSISGDPSINLKKPIAFNLNVKPIQKSASQPFVQLRCHKNQELAHVAHVTTAGCREGRSASTWCEGIFLDLFLPHDPQGSVKYIYIYIYLHMHDTCKYIYIYVNIYIYTREYIYISNVRMYN